MFVQVNPSNQNQSTHSDVVQADASGTVLLKGIETLFWKKMFDIFDFEHRWCLRHRETTGKPSTVASPTLFLLQINRPMGMAASKLRTFPLQWNCRCYKWMYKTNAELEVSKFHFGLNFTTLNHKSRNITIIKKLVQHKVHCFVWLCCPQKLRPPKWIIHGISTVSFLIPVLQCFETPQLWSPTATDLLNHVRVDGTWQTLMPQVVTAQSHDTHLSCEGAQSGNFLQRVSWYFPIWS